MSIDPNISQSTDSIGRCPICFEPLMNGENYTALECMHLFHQECIAKWVSQQPSCPLCRKITSIAGNPVNRSALSSSSVVDQAYNEDAIIAEETAIANTSTPCSQCHTIISARRYGNPPLCQSCYRHTRN
ncbi:MAG TPA: RING finger domain-containing protein [Chlamydiales bacterium]|nr:RING finger domain-containing protein [Chlamydiales bacterium]